MLFIVGVIVLLIAVVIVPRMRVPGGVNSATLGWMSEQWLAEHGARNPIHRARVGSVVAYVSLTGPRSSA
jgi:hypothetical protein